MEDISLYQMYLTAKFISTATSLANQSKKPFDFSTFLSNQITNSKDCLQKEKEKRMSNEEKEIMTYAAFL
jgi:hypothetical protein